MPPRYQDWFNQAKRDLEHAKRALRDGDYEWACFAAQQGAEKTLKAVYLKINRSAWGHSVTDLLEQLVESYKINPSLLDAGKELDKHYIPARYPNSFPQGAPFEYYTHTEAERAISHSADILAFCENLLAGSGTSA